MFSISGIVMEFAFGSGKSKNFEKVRELCSSLQFCINNSNHNGKKGGKSLVASSVNILFFWLGKTTSGQGKSVKSQRILFV